jgi:hypothetical protein
MYPFVIIGGEILKVASRGSSGIPIKNEGDTNESHVTVRY